MKLDPGFFRRLKFYLFGFLLGALIVNIVFKGRACRMPGTIKLEELREQKREFTSAAQCKMLCRNIDTSEVSQLLIQGKINYDKSKVQNKPCGTYAVEGLTKSKQEIGIMVADCDTVSKIVDLFYTGKDNCNCE